MSRLVEFPLHTGGSVLVRVDGDPPAGEVTRSWGDRDQRVIEQARQTFEQAVGRVQPALQGLVDQLRSVADSPDEVSVEFALELSAEVGAIVANASSKGNFKVAMTWRSPRAAT